MATLFNEYVFLLFIYFKCSSFAVIFFFCNLSVKTAVSSLSRLSSYFVLHHLYCRLFPSKNRGPMYLLPFFNFLIKMFWFSFVWVFFLVIIWGCSSSQTWIESASAVLFAQLWKRGFIGLWVLWKTNYPLTVSIEGNQPGSANQIHWSSVSVSTSMKAEVQAVFLICSIQVCVDMLPQSCQKWTSQQTLSKCHI